MLYKIWNDFHPSLPTTLQLNTRQPLAADTFDRLIDFVAAAFILRPATFTYL